MERSAWTGERLNNLAATLDMSIKLLREEVHTLREEMRQDFRDLRADLSACQRQIAQIGWALAAALIGAIIALIVALA